MTLIEAAASLGLDPSVLRRAIARGSLKAVRVGPLWTVTPAQVERYRAQSLGKPGRKK